METGKFKFNWPLVGNKHITDFLEKAVVGGNTAGAYIFYGPDNVGKATLAEHFAKILLCEREGSNLPCGVCSSCLSFKDNTNYDQEQLEEVRIIHGDCHIIKKEKDKKNISIEQTREFIRLLNMSSFLGSFKIGIVRDAEVLSQEAANALLKTLEEPKEKVIIILVAKNLETIPLTIISRSQFLNFYPVSADIIYDYLVNKRKVHRSQAKSLARLSLGRPALAHKYLENKEYYRLYLDKVNTFLNFLGQDMAERFSSIDKLIGGSTSGQTSASSTARILEAWESATRDWLLLELGHINLIGNQVLEKELIKTQKRFGLKELVNLLKNIRQAKSYLAANVNPRTVLEYVCLNL